MADLNRFSSITKNICEEIAKAQKKLQEAAEQLSLQITEAEAVWSGTSGEAMSELLRKIKTNVENKQAELEPIRNVMRMERSAAIKAWPEETEET